MQEHVDRSSVHHDQKVRAPSFKTRFLKASSWPNVMQRISWTTGRWVLESPPVHVVPLCFYHLLRQNISCVLAITPQAQPAKS